MSDRVMAAAALASAYAGIQTFLLRSSFHQNTPTADATLFAVWIAAYLALGFAIAFVLLLAIPASKLPAAKPLRIVGLPLLAVGPAIAIGFASSLTGGGAQEDGDTDAAALVRPHHRITLLGLDGIDPGLLESLVAQGLLPNFQRLMEGGSFGELETVSPHSPVVWTSIATGSDPAVHGVSGYTSEYLHDSSWAPPRHPADWWGRWLLNRFDLVEVAAVSANERRQKALWELLSERGLGSLVVSWWASYPADAIEGAVISNRAIPWDGFGREQLDALESIDDLTHPESLLERVRVVTEQSIRQSSSEGVARTSTRYFDVRDEIAWRLFQELRSPSHAFSTVYMQGVDTGSHGYTQAVFGENLPQARPMRVSEQEARDRFEVYVVRAYRRMDTRLGRMLELLEPDESLILVSDHGWRYDGSGHWSLPPGVVLCYGPAFREGVRLYGSHVFDILPTAAALLSMPLSSELPGKPLLAALREPELASTATTIPSYGPRGNRTAKGNRGSDEAHLDRLRALGYID